MRNSKEDLIIATRQEKTHIIIITGVLNTKIGTKEHGDRHYICHFGLENRNEREKKCCSAI